MLDNPRIFKNHEDTAARFLDNQLDKHLALEVSSCEEEIKALVKNLNRYLRTDKDD